MYQPRASFFGGGRGLVAPRRLVAAYTMYDPNSVSSGETDVSGGARFALVNETVASGLPNTGASLSILLTDLLGRTLVDSDIFDLLSAVVCYGANDPPSADMRIGCGLANAPLETATFGYGATLSASSGDWLVGHTSASAGTWSVTNAGAASASARGARGMATFMTSTTQRRVQACPLDANGVEISVANGASAIQTVAIGDSLPYFWIFAGWITGSGGTPGNVDVQAFEAVLRQNQIANQARL